LGPDPLPAIGMMDLIINLDAMEHRRVVGGVGIEESCRASGSPSARRVTM
jgi:hypothetical protein